MYRLRLSPCLPNRPLANLAPAWRLWWHRVTSSLRITGVRLFVSYLVVPCWYGEEAEELSAKSRCFITSSDATPDCGNRQCCDAHDRAVLVAEMSLTRSRSILEHGDI